MVFSHWCKYLDGVQASPQDFYRCIEEAIDRRKIPGLARTRVTWPEGGLLSAKRLYLRLTREKLLFDICAAPFGTGFFVSTRLVRREFPWFLILALILVVVFIAIWAISLLLAARQQPNVPLLIASAVTWIFLLSLLYIPTFISMCIVLFVIQVCLRRLDMELATSVLFGRIYERITGRLTYYRIDTMLMFQSAVHTAVLEIVDRHTDAQKLPRLSELERQPVMSKLLMR